MWTFYSPFRLWLSAENEIGLPPAPFSEALLRKWPFGGWFEGDSLGPQISLQRSDLWKPVPLRPHCLDPIQNYYSLSFRGMSSVLINAYYKTISHLTMFPDVIYYFSGSTHPKYYLKNCSDLALGIFFSLWWTDLFLSNNKNICGGGWGWVSLGETKMTFYWNSHGVVSVASVIRLSEANSLCSDFWKSESWCGMPLAIIWGLLFLPSLSLLTKHKKQNQERWTVLREILSGLRV